MVKSHLDKPKPTDPSRLQHFYSVISQDLMFLLERYYSYAVQTYQLGLVDGRFSKICQIERAIEYLLCKQMNVEVVNKRVIA